MLYTRQFFGPAQDMAMFYNSYQSASAALEKISGVLEEEPTVAEPEHREERPLSDSDAAAVDALPSGSALLVVQRGPSAGSRFLLDTEVVSAGRHPDSEIFLDDVTVSRRHAEFRRTPEGFTVADVGSLNGTYVNRDRIDEVALQGGDEVQIVKYRLVFLTGAKGSS